MAQSYFGTYLCKLTTCLCWPLFQEWSVVNLDRFHCTRMYSVSHSLPNPESPEKDWISAMLAYEVWDVAPSCSKYPIESSSSSSWFTKVLKISIYAAVVMPGSVASGTHCRRSVLMETYSFPGKERLGREIDHSPPLVPRPGMTSCISECEWHK